MGQGTESCDGYEVDYCPYYDGLASGNWTQRDGTEINIKKMTIGHLYGAKKIAQRAAQRAVFTSNSEVFKDWVSLFDCEINLRHQNILPSKNEPKSLNLGKTVAMRCHCGEKYDARKADIERGWGLSCSKSCAATRRDFGRPAAKPIP
jgi:hypothetical protein